ncbi:MAG: M48 family metallopeptidase [Luteibaculaceae bacterium]
MLAHAQSRVVLSSGDIPENNVKAQDRLQKFLVDQDISSKDKSAKEFYLRNFYFLNTYLFSGSLSFNDEIAVYIDKIVDKLLINEPELRNQLKVVTYKTPSVNAAASDLGYIIINLGLMAQVENEAQLAFVISHEIAHIRKKHNLQGFQARLDLLKNKSIRTQSAYYFFQSEYAKEIEYEADLNGLKTYLDAGYDPSEAIAALEMLRYSYLPLEQIPVTHKSIWPSLDSIPAILRPTSINPINSLADYDDTFHSHPNIGSRIDALITYLEVIKAKEGESFIVSKEDFERTSLMAKQELIRQLLIRGYYADAFYNALVLLEKNPNDTFALIAKTNALYNEGITKANFKNKGKRDKKLAKIQGESYNIHYYFQNTGEVGILTAALNSFFQYKDLFTPQEFETKVEHIVYTLIQKHNITPNLLDDFLTMNNLNLIADATDSTNAEVVTIGSRQSSKYYKSKYANSNKSRSAEPVEERQTQEENKTTSRSSLKGTSVAANRRKMAEERKQLESLIFYKELASTIQKNDELKTMWPNIERLVKENKAKSITSKGVTTGSNFVMSQEYDKSKSIVVFNPSFNYGNENIPIGLLINRNEQESTLFSRYFSNAANKSKVNIYLLETGLSEKMDADKLNKISLINDAITEGENSNWTIYSAFMPELQALSEELGTRYILLTSLEAEKLKDSPNKIEYNAMVFDLVKGKILFRQNDIIRGNMLSSAMYENLVYNTFYKLKK